MKNLVAQQNFSGDKKAFSAVLTQAGNAMDIFGRLCSYEDKLKKNFFTYNGISNWGYYILFQTR